MLEKKGRIFLLVSASLIGVVAFYLNTDNELDYHHKKKSNREDILTNLDEIEKIKTASGLQYRIIKEGEGVKNPSANSVVTVHYVGKLENGSEFDSSFSRNQPASFPVNGVIPGWTEALQLMRIGDKWELTIPPELGYGSEGAGNTIPPNATLIFEVELLEID